MISCVGLDDGLDLEVETYPESGFQTSSRGTRAHMPS